MIDRRDALRQVHTMVLRHLDGHQDFETTAQDLAVILREASHVEVIYLLYSVSLRLTLGRPTDHSRGIEVVQAARRIAGASK